MKTYRVVRACPKCESDVWLEYDVGQDRDEFYVTDDDVSCLNDHQVPHGVLEAWTSEDAEAYGMMMYERMTDARYYHDSGGL